MEILVSGSIALNGIHRCQVTVPEITVAHKVFLKMVSSAMKGVVVISEITAGEGFGLSSTSADDVGMLVYFDVYLQQASVVASE
jgi:hypothetical protein